MKKLFRSLILASGIFITHQIAGQSLTTGLVDCMNFNNDLSFGTDYVSAKPSGAYYDYTTDKLGNTNSALQFSGSQKNASLTFTSSLTDKNNYWTVSLWLKPNSMPQPGFFSYLYSIGSSGGDQTIILKSSTIEIGNYQISGAAQSLVSEQLSANFADSWHHIVALKKQDSLQLYIDGVLNKSVFSSKNTSYYGTSSLPTEKIGCRFNSTNYFSGAIDQFRRYKGAITKLEIDSLFKTPFLPVTKVKSNNTLVRFLSMSNNFYDEISNTAPSVANVTFTNDKIGSSNAAANFYNSQSVIYTGYQIKRPDLWTISLWIKPNSLSDGLSYLYSCGSTGGDQTISLNNNVLSVGNYTQSTVSHALDSKVLPSNFIDAWHHIVAVKKTDSLVLYIDGVLNTSVYYTDNTSYYGYGTYAISLGARFDNTFQYNGSIDQYKRYSRPLSKQEVVALNNDYQGTCGTLPNNLLNCVSFDNNMFDEATNNYVGQYNVPSPTYTTDKLNNSNHAIQVGDMNSTVDVTPTILSDLWTISMWIKPTMIPTTGQVQYFYSLGAYGGDQTLSLTSNNIVLGNYVSDISAYGLTSNLLSSNFVNNWHHIAAVKKQDSLLLYIDGVLEGSIGNVNSTSYYGQFVPTFQKLGARYDYSYPFKGNIDQFSRFGRPLTRTEVTELYQNYSKSCGVVSGIFDEQKSSKLFSIYPNPVKDQLEVDLSSITSAAQLELYNSTGNLILKQDIRNTTKTNINTEHLISGVYVVKIISPDKVYAKKMLKE